MTATFFSTQWEFRKWLENNHKKETELLVGFYRVSTSKPSLTWSQSVDQALCFGWIDGIRRKIDEESYSIRFTPRRRKSNWSAINMNKVEELIKLGLITEEGLKAYELRSESNSRNYIHERESVKLDPKYENLFKTNKLAWVFFEKQAPSYKKAITHWIMDAKQEKTRLSRLKKQ